MGSLSGAGRLFHNTGPLNLIDRLIYGQSAPWSIRPIYWSIPPPSWSICPVEFEGRKDRGHGADQPLETEFIGDEFLQGDINDKGHRQVLLATPAMLQLLGQYEHWYMDSTFKVIKEPFGQLFAIHGFIRSGESIKRSVLCCHVTPHKEGLHCSSVGSHATH